MLKIIYSKNGYAYHDFNLLKEAQQIIDYYQTHKDEDVVNVSTSNIVVALRVLVLRGKINCSDITFEFKGEIIKIDKRGKFSNYPKGFIDWYDDFLDEMLGI